MLKNTFEDVHNAVNEPSIFCLVWRANSSLCSAVYWCMSPKVRLANQIPDPHRSDQSGSRRQTFIPYSIFCLITFHITLVLVVTAECSSNHHLQLCSYLRCYVSLDLRTLMMLMLTMISRGRRSRSVWDGSPRTTRKTVGWNRGRSRSGCFFVLSKLYKSCVRVDWLSGERG